MIIKDEFELLKGTKNTISTSSDRVDKLIENDNSYQRLRAILKLNENRIKHEFKSQIFSKLKDDKFASKFKIVEIDRYQLPITFNQNDKSIIMNIKYFDAKEISQLDPRTLYSCILYGTIFSKLVSKGDRVSPNYAAIFINYLLAMFIRLFGKQYGLLGSYSTEIPKLKFLISVYVLESFFGLKGSENYRRASSISQFSYKEIEDKLDKYDFSDISDFISALSDMKVLIGINKYRFTEKILKFLTINFIPALEDCSRFVASISASSVSGNKLVPSFIYRYNEDEHAKIVSLSRKFL